MTISNPAHWKEPYADKGDKYDKIAEMIIAINAAEGIGAHASTHELEGGDLVDHNNLTNYVANRHKTEAEMSLANLGTRTHASLSDSPESAHHTKFTGEEAISAVEGEATLELGAQVKIAGRGWFEGGSSPSGTAALEYNGYLYATRFYNAVYNDYADFWGKLAEGEKAVPGRVYIALPGRAITQAKKRNDFRAIGICTNNYGFSVGEKIGEVPISVAGFVEAYVDKVYKPGTKLTNDNSGGLTKAHFWERKLGIFICKGVFNKCWIKVN